MNNLENQGENPNRIGRIKVFLHFSRALYGSSEYTATAEITNLTGKTISQVSVEPLCLPGALLSVRGSISYSRPKNPLEEERITLVKTIERQILDIYKREKFWSFNTWRIKKTIENIWTGKEDISTWIEPVLKVNTVEDIKEISKKFRLTRKYAEKGCIDTSTASENNGTPEKLQDSPFVIKELLINVNNLKKIEGKIKENLKKEMKNPETGEDQKIGTLITEDSSTISIEAGDSVTYTFLCQAPYLWTQKSFEAQFKVLYCINCITGDKNKNEQYFQHIERAQLVFYASPRTVYSGAMVGAVIGYVVKETLVSNLVPKKSFLITSFDKLIASVLLAFIVAVVTVRSPESSSKKFFAVEDFMGGIITGALSSLFSENFIEFLNATSRKVTPLQAPTPSSSPQSSSIATPDSRGVTFKDKNIYRSGLDSPNLPKLKAAEPTNLNAKPQSKQQGKKSIQTK